MVDPSPLDVRWSRRRDSNPEPAVYKTAALPVELRRRDGQGHTAEDPFRRREMIGRRGRMGQARGARWREGGRWLGPCCRREHIQGYIRTQPGRAPDHGPVIPRFGAQVLLGAVNKLSRGGPDGRPAPSTQGALDLMVPAESEGRRTRRGAGLGAWGVVRLSDALWRGTLRGWILRRDRTASWESIHEEPVHKTRLTHASVKRSLAIHGGG